MSGVTYTKAASLAATPRAGRSPITLTRSRSLSDEKFTALINDKPTSNGKTPIRDNQVTGTTNVAVDPFTANMRPSMTTSVPFRHLSAGATNFQPRNNLPSNMSILNRESFPDASPSSPVIVSSQSLTTIDEKPSPGEDDDDSAPTNDQSRIDKGKGRAQDAIGTRTAPTDPTQRIAFTTDQILGGHYMRIDCINPLEYEHYMKRLATERDWENKVLAQKAFMDSAAKKKSLSVALCFDDIAAAGSAEDDVNMIKPSWTISYISAGEFADVQGFGDNATSFFDGQVYYQATYEGDFEKVNVPHLEEHVYRLAGNFGSVIAFQRVTNTCPTYIFRVEYQCISQAKEVLKELTADTPHYFEDWVVSTKPLKDPVDNTSKRSSTSSTLSQYHIVTTPHRISSQGANTAFTSPSGRTAWQQNEDGTMVVVPAPRVVDKVYQTPAGGSGYGNGHHRHNSGSSPHTPAPFNSGNRGMGNRNDSWSSRPSRNVENDYPTNGEPQSVNVERIMSGVDVRTTIMLRNLPNQWGASHMKSILDTTSWGCYDFSYLRIDFQRNTNVGYAFVNFCQATDIVPFYQTYIGREWDPSTPGRKRAQISYATIQGFDCLIEKFRNSSIMDEYAEFRPKIWWTKFAAEAEGKAEKIGTEKEFPAPNNLSKKQRSHDNAGSIGLYAPRSGQRGTDRHRRSLYDRGTSAQIREDAMLNQMSPMGNNYTYQPGPGPIGPPPAFGQYYNAPPNYTGNAFFPVNDGNQGRFINQDPFQAAYHPQMPMYSGVPNYTTLQYNNNNVSIMGTNNPASGLRTISRGRLAGRPRNVTTAPNVFDGTAPAIEPAYGVNFNPVMYGEQGGPSSHSAPRSMHQHSQGPSTQHYQQHHASAFMPARGNVQHHGLPASHQAGLILGPNEYVNSYGQIEMAGSSSGHFHQNGASLSPTQTIGYPQQNEYINGHGQVDMAESSSQAQMQARHST